MSGRLGGSLPKPAMIMGIRRSFAIRIHVGHFRSKVKPVEISRVASSAVKE